MHNNSVILRALEKDIYIYILLISSLISTIITIIADDNTGFFQYFFLLPLCHTLVLCGFGTKLHYVKTNITFILLLGGYTIRNAIAPLFFALGGYEYFGRNAIRVISEVDVVKSIAIMIYETVIVLFLYVYFSKRLKKQSINTNTIKYSLPNFSSWYTLILIIINIIMVIAFLQLPNIGSSFISLWSSNATDLTGSFSEIVLYSAGSSNRLLYSFFLMFFSLMQFIWSMYLIYFLHEISKGNFWGVLLSLFVIVANTMFVTESNAFTLFVIVILFVFSSSIFERQKEKVTLMALICSGIVLFALISIRFIVWNVSGSDMFAVIGTFLNAYVPGLQNISAIWHVEPPNLINTFYYDLYMSIPLQSIIPPLVEGERLSVYFNSAANVKYQILPFCAQTFFYFGIFGPFVQVLCIRFAILSEYNYMKEDNCLLKLGFLTAAVFLSAGCTVYNITSILTCVWKVILPLLILGKLSNKAIHLNG